MLKNGKFLAFVTSAFFFISIFVLFGSKLVCDNDFWWHLKTGQYIVEQRELPKSDPFSYAPFFSPRKGMESFVLTSYWLSQALLYGTFKAFGFSGVLFLKAMIYTAIFFVQWLWMKREKVPDSLGYALIGFGVYVMLFTFPGERPQVVTFLFAVTVVFLLEEFRRHGKWLPVLPAIMVVWANIHGGFFVGIVIIVVYLIIGGIELGRRKLLLPGYSYKKLLAWGLLSIVVSSVNPNTYHVFPLLLDVNNSAVVKDVTEFQNIFTILTQYRFTGPVVFTGIIVIFAVTGLIANRRRLDPAHVVLLAGVVIGGCLAYRLFAFTVAIGVPIIGIYLGKSINALSSKTFFENRKNYISYFIHAAVSIVSIAIIGLFIKERMFLENDYNRTLFPVKAVDFIENNYVRGDIFNNYNAGGYLIWRLYPQHKVFIDGRAISDEAYEEYLVVLSGYAASSPDVQGWEQVLDRFGLQVILINPLDEVTGDILPLISALIASDAWRLIYYDGRDVIFVKNVPAFGEAIRIYNMPKERAYFTVLALAEQGIAETPQNSHFYLSGGLALRALGRDEEAKVFLEKAREMLPRLKPGMESR
jgi:hypothetical protein